MEVALPPRQTFTHEGRVVYEWTQSLDDVFVFIRPPAGVRGAAIACAIAPSRVTLGLKGNPPFLDHALPRACAPSASCWTLADGELTLTLGKAAKGEAWPAAFAGHERATDAAAADAAARAMLLERFQQEHPGFDFRGADVTGAVPDARSFMGGINQRAFDAR